MSVFGDFQVLGSIGAEPETYTHDPESITSTIVEDEPEQRQMQPFLAIMVLIFSVLIIRLLTLQVSQGTKNLGLAEGNRIRVRTTPAPRGIIYDQVGVPLLKNIARYDFVVIPADLPAKKDDRQNVYKTIKEKLPQVNVDIPKEVEKKGLYSLEPIVIEENITHEKAIEYQLIFQDVSGLDIVEQPIRSYEKDKGLGHVLGYIGKISEKELNNQKDYLPTDWYGKAGIEKSYEKDLKGRNGQEQIEIDSRGRLQRVVASQSPQQGNNLTLNIDLKVQEATYNALKQAAKDNNASKGAAVAMNPKTGEVYALVSMPDYDPNAFVTNDKKAVSDLFTNEDKPLLNRVIGGAYPSGSSIKPVYAAAGLQEKVISPTFAVDTPSEIRIGESVFPDWKDHGLTDIRRAIAESNNIIFYAIGGGWDKIGGLGIKRIVQYLKMFNFGEATEIDLPGEVTGFVPTPEWKKEKKKEPWYIGDTYHLAIGQGDISTTPIQLLEATSTIVNDGKIVKPILAKNIKSADGVELSKFQSQSSKEIAINKENLKIVREGMRQTVESGSARNLQDVTWSNGGELKVAGKTGTAQTGKGENTHAWFVGFAPYDDPKMVLTVLVEDGGEGHTAAVPVAKEMFKAFFREDNPAAK